MIKKQYLSANMMYQFLYQIIILVIPLVLSPYLTRTLQETSLGIYSYSHSISYYFVMFSMLGISRYGQRIVSENIEDEVCLRKVFWSLFATHILVGLVCVGLYICLICIVSVEHKAVYIAQTFYVISAMFDITWLFYGLENFKGVVARNSVLKIVECILIFLFVKEPDDLLIYTLICALGVLIGHLVMLPYAIRSIRPIKFNGNDMVCHIKPLLWFFISIMSVSLYTVFDKILLGLMTTEENVAFYEYSNKLINVPKTMIGVVGTVMFPRVCRLVKAGNVKEQGKYVYYSLLLSSFIAFGAILGIVSFGPQFTVIYYGERFAICGNLVVLLCPLIYIIGMGDILRTQYMIPNHMDKAFNLCIALNAVINLLLNLVLIPKLGIYGAIIGTLAAELFGVIFQIVVCKKFVKMKLLFETFHPFFMAALFSYFILEAMKKRVSMELRGIIVLFLIGVCLYSGFSGIFCALVKRKRR